MTNYLKTRNKKYDRFLAKHINDSWCVVTEPDGIIIAKIPHFIAYPAAVARTLALALTKSKYVLTDLL